MGTSASVRARSKLEARKAVESPISDSALGVDMTSQQTIRVVAAEYVRDYLIRLTFSDGNTKVVDFSQWLHGEVFRPLSDKRQFKRFFLAGGTVCWPNGADIAPETLRAVPEASTN